MKKFFTVLLLVVLVMGVAACSENEEKKIRSTLDTFFDGWKNEDIDKISSVISPNYNDGEITSKESYLAYLALGLALVDISDINATYNSIAIVKDTAEVECVVNVTSQFMGETQTSTQTNIFSLEKIDSEWYIKSQIEEE